MFSIKQPSTYLFVHTTHPDRPHKQNIKKAKQRMIKSHVMRGVIQKNKEKDTQSLEEFEKDRENSNGLMVVQSRAASNCLSTALAAASKIEANGIDPFHSLPIPTNARIYGILQYCRPILSSVLKPRDCLANI